MSFNRIKHVLISRVDAIGDVVLTLPMCKLIKEHYPDIKISFLGRNYTKSVVACCGSVDEFISYDDILAMKDLSGQVNYVKSLKIDQAVHVFPKKDIAMLMDKAGVPVRVGTRNRWYHWLYCNSLVKLSRKNSALHEAELNMALLTKLEIDKTPNAAQIAKYYDFSRVENLLARFRSLIDSNKFNLIIHPLSNGSGKEWSLERYSQLIRLLSHNKQIKLFVTGSDKEREMLKPWLSTLPADVVNLTGTMPLTQFVAFISSVDGLIASGTGPLHLAAAVGVHTLGLFPNVKPINAQRWRPIGEKATFLESESESINDILAKDLMNIITGWVSYQEVESY
ncbi:glycosyltransferase family 9 protein [Olivibacter sp. XZL3]|uniref:glycosyltransferase family 9 protein n=1 Tax=Olivibacter sp. XZL3 TaxID=1735116 RepID=UPI0010650C25|nr:glycosyltransferase family 9 protein [Olivibacter sp. XZL3]